MKYTYYILALCVAVAFASCAPDKSDVKDMRDIIPKADRDYNPAVSDSSKSNDSLAILQDQFSELGIAFDSINKVSNRLMIDRFGHLSNEKFELIGSGQVLHIYKWTYKDSARVTNALFNWIDCFGDGCKSIQVGETKNLQNDAFHLYANDEVIIFVESDHAIKTRSVEAYLESVGYEKEWNYVLEQARSGKVRWFKFEEEKKLHIKREK
ncbi:MAG: hypothetical protein ACI865_001983 [Flavobacteriaceae bacterium]|jgi:hypothetical protein